MSIAQLLERAYETGDDFDQAQRELEEESKLISERYQANLRTIGNEIAPYLSKLEGIISEIQELTPTKQLLCDILWGLKDRLDAMRRTLQEGAVPEMKQPFGYESVITLPQGQYEVTTRDSEYVSWKETHPAKFLRDYMNDLLQSTLEKHMGDSISVHLGSPHLFDGRNISDTMLSDPNPLVCLEITVTFR